jgi:cytochrome c
MVFAAAGMFLIQLCAQTPGQPGQGSRSVWDGVYNQAQADRGNALYSHECASCHGDNLMGKESENSPALTGERFTSQWDGRTVGDMFRKILRKMPQDDPGTLSPQQSVDLVAFLLSFNKFPAGKAELPPQNDVLAGIRFDQKKIEQK